MLVKVQNFSQGQESTETAALAALSINSCRRCLDSDEAGYFA
jgi:hypothetical protein